MLTCLDVRRYHLRRSVGRCAMSTETLDSWKNIASYLDRAVRTVMRWEYDRGLPVHRLPGGGKPGVYALRSELDTWRTSAQPSLSNAPRDAPVPATPEPRPSRARLVVLPFVNLSGDPAQECSSDAMTDEVITALASLAPERLAVIARTTAMHYKGNHKDVARIARELRVDYVVEGACRRNGGKAVVNVQLIQTSDQSHLFAKRYEAELRDIYYVHGSIAQDIATHVDAPGVVEEVRGRLTWAHGIRTPTENLAAYDDYIRGRYLRLTPEAMAGARRHFEDAIARDPDFARAHMALADLYTWLAYPGYMRPKDAYGIGFPHALRAVEIDDALAEAHAVLAEYHKQLAYDWPAAEREMQRALELDPASPYVRFYHAFVILMPRQRLQEAVRELERALETDPLAVGTRFWLGTVRLLARDHDGALDEARSLLELEPTSWLPPLLAGLAYRQKYSEELLRGCPRPDLAQKAVAWHRRALELAPGAEQLLGWLGFALAVCDRKDEARAVLEQLHRSDHYVLPALFGHLHLGLGELDAAFDWFDRAVEEHDQCMMPILSYAHFDPIRGDPRFARLLAKMRLGSEPSRPALSNRLGFT